MTDQTVTIKINVPDENTPGFARRLYRAASFQERVKGGEFSASLVKEMVEFLSDYIEGDKEQACEYLWDCSQRKFMQMLEGVSGGASAEVPPV